MTTFRVDPRIERIQAIRSAYKQAYRIYLESRPQTSAHYAAGLKLWNLKSEVLELGFDDSYTDRWQAQVNGEVL